MGIDGIRRNQGPAKPPPAAEDSAPKAEFKGPFGLSEASPTKPADAVVASPGALAQLRSGAIDLNGYLNLKVEDATRHLKGLPAPELERIRSSIRDRLATDPALRELVQTATGQVPPSEDAD